MARPLRLLAVLVALIAVPVQAQSSDTAKAFAAASARAVAPEGTTVRILDESPGSVTVEVTANWSQKLAEAKTPFSADGLAAALVGSEATATTLIELGARVPPQVQVLEAEGDDLTLAGASRVAKAFSGPLAEVVGVGERRRRTVGSLRVRMLRVEGDEVTRYRRVVVRVTRTAPQTFALRMSRGSSHLAVTRSALAEGRWFKLPVPASGVYRITRALLTSLGLDPNTIDPNRVATYHNGGKPLPEITSAVRPADLVETPSLVIGGGDGSFGDGDAVILYAQGPRGWQWSERTSATAEDDGWDHVLNPFTTTSYVFIRVDAPSAARVSGASFPGWTDAQPLATVTGRVVAERDLENLEREGSGSGLHWLGEEVTLSASGVTVLDTIPPDRVGPVRYRAQLAARANPATRMTISRGSQEITQVTPRAINFGTATGYLATLAVADVEVTPEASLSVTVRAPGASSSAKAWIDWVEATFQRAPRASGGTLQFPTPGGQSGRFEVAVEGFAAAPEVWDVTEPGTVRRLGVQADGNRYRVQVEASGESREVVAFDPGAPLRTFSGGTAVANQNLHGITGFPDYVIIVHESLRAAADRLAAHRETTGLSTLVVDVDEVQNEFGGGTLDMRAMRDYMKFLYDRAPDEASLPQHLLLFGDGHMDFRGIENGPPILIPTYQTDEMLEQVRSYTSDDYFGLLGDTEGVWEWVSGQGNSSTSFERVDIGIGRFPVRTSQEANLIVDKILRYENPETRGDWRTRMTFLGDDQYPNDGDLDLHVQNADAVAKRIPDEEAITIQKIYMPSYPEVTTASGRRRPAATEASRRAINEGTLVWNYMGHGGPEGLADEQLFTAAVVEGLNNEDRLPIFVTATCSFGKYDMVDQQSLAEETLLHEGGGAIAMFTTVRVVFTFSSESSLNLGLNIQLTRAMFDRDANGRPRRLGDILADAKNTDVGAQRNNRKFNLLGDPGMRIGLPERTVRFTHINGQPLPASGALPQLRAFETARVQGEVLGFDGNPDPAFEGSVSLTAFDAKRDIQLPIAVYIPSGTYSVQTDPIYQGRASVRGGRFDATFLVPQDVSYSGENARISAYAIGGDTDGLGQTQEAIIAEDAATRPDDGVGPDVRLFLDDTTFVSGGLSRPDPVLLARMSDASGINTVGAGVGHELLLTLDGDPTQAIDVGRYYEGDLDTFRSGTLRYPLAELEPGPHTLTLTAWDGANNATTQELSFVVSEGSELRVENAYPYPNPTSGRSTFFFEHNQPPGTPARIQLRIYSLAGRPVRTLEREEPLNGGLVRIDWDGLDDDLDRLASGVYLYRLRVEVDGADGTRRVAERRDRLAVIR